MQQATRQRSQQHAGYVTRGTETRAVPPTVAEQLGVRGHLREHVPRPAVRGWDPRDPGSGRAAAGRRPRPPQRRRSSLGLQLWRLGGGLA